MYLARFGYGGLRQSPGRRRRYVCNSYLHRGSAPVIVSFKLLRHATPRHATSFRIVASSTHIISQHALSHPITSVSRPIGPPPPGEGGGKRGPELCRYLCATQPSANLGAHTRCLAAVRTGSVAGLATPRRYISGFCSGGPAADRT